MGDRLQTGWCWPAGGRPQQPVLAKGITWLLAFSDSSKMIVTSGVQVPPGDFLAELEELAATADGLTALIPEATPPEGFSDRAMAMIRAEHGAPHRPFVRRLAAVAAVVALLALGGGVGAIVSSTGHDAPATAVRSAPLHSTSGAEGTVLLVSTGQKGWLVMTLHDAPTSGTVTCTLALADGTHRAIGAFSLATGYGSWTARIPVPVSSVRWVDVVNDGGTTVASARIG